MRKRYYELVGMEVVTADGAKVGRVADLVAEAEGDALCVTTLLVGPTALLQRISFKHSRMLQRNPPIKIPWRLVAGIDKHIRLRVMSHDLDGVQQRKAILDEKRR